MEQEALGAGPADHANCHCVRPHGDDYHVDMPREDELQTMTRLWAREEGIDALALRSLSSLPHETGAVAAFFPPVRSLMAAARSYRASDEDAVFDEEKGPRGEIARYTRSNAYGALRKAMKRFLGRWQDLVAPLNFRLSINGRVLREKALALATGLGALGRHGVVLLPHHGPHVVLAIALLDLELPPSLEGWSFGSGPSPCLGCGACVAACPTGALGGKGLDRSRCIQALCTLPGALPAEVEALWGNRLYGCSSCQDACPVGRDPRPVRSLPLPGRLGASLPLRPFLEGDLDELIPRLRGNQMGASWVPLEALQRNARLCLRHGDHAPISGARDPNGSA